MFVLNAENRSAGFKPKQLRRKGMIPGVLYGKNLKESLSIQFSRAEAASFLKANFTGSKVKLVIGDNNFMALLCEATYKPVSNELEHLSFQTLVAGEVVTSAARIVLVNREKVTGMVQQPQSEVSYRALPSNLIDKIAIDLDGMKIGTSMRIGDLDIAKNPDIEVLSPLDTMVFSIAGARTSMKTPETDAEVPESE